MTTSLIRPIAVNVNTGDVTYSGSIDSSEITDGSIVAADLATGAVTTTGILDATIGVADMSAAALAGRNLYLAANYQ